MIDTKPFIMNTKKPHPWRKLAFDMLPFGFDGTRLKLLMKAPFTSSTIGSIFDTFMCDNGEALC